MLVLEAGQACQYKAECSKASFCYGARTDRDNVFKCQFVNDEGKLIEGVRIPMDKTGLQQVIME